MKLLSRFLLTFLTVIMIKPGAEAQQLDADTLYSQGIDFMNQATDWKAKSNFPKTREYNQKAIDKFVRLLQLNERYAGANASIAHCYYESQQYREARTWYEKAIIEDSTLAGPLAETGLCNIYLGDADTAVYFIHCAIRHDSSDVFVKHLSSSMVDIAEQIEGKANLISKKDPEKGNEQFRVALKILMVAFDMDPYRSEVAKNISDLGFRLNDFDIASKYLKYSIRQN